MYQECVEELQVFIPATATLPKCWLDLPLLVACAQLLVNTHNSLGHCRGDKLLSALCGSYWWLGMYVDIADCIWHCLVCQQDKVPALLKEELRWMCKGGTPFIR